jgi:glycerophosphoryl diester phosphodiesterase
VHECGWQEAAYRLALDSQVDCMEIDVSRTLDGVLVTLHDRYGFHFVCLQWDYYSCKLHLKKKLFKMGRVANKSRYMLKIQSCPVPRFSFVSFLFSKLSHSRIDGEASEPFLIFLKGRDLQAMHGNPAVQVGHFTFSQVRSLLSYMLNK